MKSEPLKERGLNEDDIYYGKMQGVFYSLEDVKSAVEWLKEEITKQKLLQEGLIFHLINKAFEDVTK